MAAINIGFYSKNGTTKTDYDVHALLISNSTTYHEVYLYTKIEDAKKNKVYLGNFDENLADRFYISVWVIRRKKPKIKSNVKIIEFVYSDYAASDPKDTIYIDAAEQQYSPVGNPGTKTTKIVIGAGSPQPTKKIK